MMEHALATETGWRDYGSAARKDVDLWGQFLELYSNLVRNSSQEFDHHDRNRFWVVFKSAAEKDRWAR